MTNQTPHPETDLDYNPQTWYQPIRLFWLPIILFLLLFVACAVIVYVKNREAERINPTTK